jgi:AMP-binding enzyme C-terminal domain
MATFPAREPGLCRLIAGPLIRWVLQTDLDILVDRQALISEFRTFLDALADRPCFGPMWLCHAALTTSSRRPPIASAPTRSRARPSNTRQSWKPRSSASRTRNVQKLVKAFVVLRSGYQPAPELAEELQQFVKTRLAAHAYPREIEFIERLPNTPSGKLQRFILRLRTDSGPLTSAQADRLSRKTSPARIAAGIGREDQQQTSRAGQCPGQC